MANKYIDVPRDLLVARLEQAGFKREDRRGEVVYYRGHDRHPRLRVVVFTSLPEFDVVARGCGEDAIRVQAQLTWTPAGTDVPRFKKLWETRVYRVNSVEGVLGRTVDAAREAYRQLNEWLKRETGGRL
jgi:hypothetical protein